MLDASSDQFLSDSQAMVILVYGETLNFSKLSRVHFNRGEPDHLSFFNSDKGMLHEDSQISRGSWEQEPLFYKRM